MGMFDLPRVERIKTPGFVQGIDETMESRCICAGFTTAGSTWRMWIIYAFQIFFLFLCVVIGANIQNGVGYLGPTFDAVDILRLVGGIPGIVAALMGGVGVYIRMRYLLMGTIVLDSIALLFLFLSWAIDAADASDLNGRINQTPVNFVPSRDKAITACIFGVFGWVVTMISVYLTYAHYQELETGGPSPSSRRTEENAPKIDQAQSTVTIVTTSKQVQQTVGPTSDTSIARPLKPSQQPSKPKQAATTVHNCPQCDSEWPVDVKFCGECGSQIPDLNPEPVATSPKPSELWEEHFTEDGYMYYYNPKTGESKWAEA